jgi:hypothetical protein
MKYKQRRKKEKKNHVHLAEFKNKALWNLIGEKLGVSSIPEMPKILTVDFPHKVWLTNTRHDPASGMKTDIDPEMIASASPQNCDAGLITIANLSKEQLELTPEEFKKYDYVISIDLSPKTEEAKLFDVTDYKALRLIHELIHVYEHELNRPFYHGSVGYDLKPLEILRAFQLIKQEIKQEMR